VLEEVPSPVGKAFVHDEVLEAAEGARFEIMISSKFSKCTKFAASAAFNVTKGKSWIADEAMVEILVEIVRRY